MERMVGNGRLDGGAPESLLSLFYLVIVRDMFTSKKSGKEAGRQLRQWDIRMGVLWSMGVLCGAEANPLWRRLSVGFFSSPPDVNVF